MLILTNIIWKDRRVLCAENLFCIQYLLIYSTNMMKCGIFIERGDLMAIPVNIDDLINRRIVESNRVEFKPNR